MPKRGTQLSVFEILQKAQETAGGHVKYARMLWAVEASDSDRCYQDLFKAISHLVTIPQVSQVLIFRHCVWQLILSL